MTRRRDPLERFWSHVPDRGDGCWLWDGLTDKGGYALFFTHKIDGRSKYALGHRWIYQHEVGPIPDGLVIDHVATRGCSFRHCVRPDHLEPVTRWENTYRGGGLTVRHALKTHCDRGHPFDAENTALSAGDLGWPRRRCRACSRLTMNERRARRRAERRVPRQDVTDENPRSAS